MSTLCIELLLATSTLLAAGDPTVPPLSIQSPSKAWTLRMDPRTFTGYRTADFTLSQSDRSGKPITAWKGLREFTLRDVQLSDRGWIYGWAVVRAEFAKPDELGTVRIVAMDAEGLTRVEDRMIETPWPRGGGGPMAPPLLTILPRVLAILPMESENVLSALVFRGGEDQRDEEVQVYDAMTGSRTATFTVFPDRWIDRRLAETTRLLEWLAIPDTSLLLLHGWRGQYASEPGGKDAWSERWVVLDAQGASVFEHEEPDPRVVELRQSLEVASSLRGKLAAHRPGTFSFFLRGRRETVTKQCKKGDEGQWIVADAPPAVSK